MTITITIPDRLAVQLEQRADLWRRTVEDVALDILRDALSEPAPESVEAVVARIKATEPSAHGVRPAEGSLADALRRTSRSAEFDLEQWKREWREVEAEMRATDLANEHAEGRG